MAYGKVHGSFWRDMEDEGVSDGGMLLFLYLITCEHRNIIGLYRLPFAYVSADLRCDLETVSKRFAELVEKGFVKYDESTKVVFVRNFLKYNPLDNANVEKNAVKAVQELPKTALLREFETVLKGFGNRYETLLETVSNSITVTITKTITITEEERVPGAETSSAPAPREEKKMAQQVEDPADGVVERLPLNSGEYEVTETQAQEWARLYPAVDVASELRKMRGWLLANPSKRKTKSGIARFANSWLAREQDRGPVKTRGTKQDSFDMSASERYWFEQIDKMEV